MRVHSFLPLVGFTLVSAHPNQPRPHLHMHAERALQVDSGSLPSGWSSRGCFTDSVQQRALGLGGFNDPAMTSAKCITYCSKAGFNLAGTEYHSECYCGYELANSKQAPATDCNTACSGSSNEPCGGPDRLNVFSNGKKPPREAPAPAGWKSLGCYTDSQTDRTLPIYLPGGSSPFTVKQCTAACSLRGYNYAGVEYGQECFCGNSIGPSGAPAQTGCNMACSGDTTQLCGGRDRMNLYSVTSSASTTTTSITTTSRSALSTTMSSTIKSNTTTASTTALSTSTTTIGSTTTTSTPVSTIVPWSNYTKNGVFYPSRSAGSWRTLYARTLQLPDLSLLLTWEDYDPTVNLTYWPVYKSVDGGVSFQPFSRVEDKVNGWGNWYQPFLYALPQAFGGYPAGTILITGVSTPRDLSKAYIDLYASTDQGKSWEFVSHILYGEGREVIDNGQKAIWEPFLMMYQGKLVCYYSDQRDPKHAQKLSHMTTTDLKTWSDPVDDVAQADYNQRPGMTTVAYSEKSKKYVMTFEFCGGPLTGGCPVYFKVANSPLEFGPVDPLPLVNNAQADPNGSPYVIWTPNPGATDGSGIFIANGNSKEALYINDDNVSPDGWRAVDVGQWSAYSRSLRIIDTPLNSAAKGKKKLFIANGGNIGCEGSCYNYVADALVDIPSYPGRS